MHIDTNCIKEHSMLLSKKAKLPRKMLQESKIMSPLKEMSESWPDKHTFNYTHFLLFITETGGQTDFTSIAHSSQIK